MHTAEWNIKLSTSLRPTLSTDHMIMSDRERDSDKSREITPCIRNVKPVVIKFSGRVLNWRYPVEIADVPLNKIHRPLVPSCFMLSWGNTSPAGRDTRVQRASPCLMLSFLWSVSQELHLLWWYCQRGSVKAYASLFSTQCARWSLNWQQSVSFSPHITSNGGGGGEIDQSTIGPETSFTFSDASP